MSTISNTQTKEIVNDFCTEALKLYSELEEILLDLESNPSNRDEFEKFGQVIDRVMGAAKAVGADEIGKFCELGKAIGYKASQVQDTPLLNIVVAVLSDAVDLLKRMTMTIQTGEETGLENMNTSAFVSRLKWLSGKFKSIKRSSVSIEAKSDADIDELLNNLGL
ncbi:MAG: hypothetical protein KAQ98_00035 [Bacteriovoracaceae bacterium]|nr:hypothetical protein [Bacteriovoracaceae bacterium]